MLVTIYALVFLDGSGVYVGATGNPDRRHRQHLAQLITKTHPNIRLQNTYNQHPDQLSYLILQTLTPVTVDDICDCELKWQREVIDTHDRPYLLNLVVDSDPDSFSCYNLPRR